MAGSIQTELPTLLLGATGFPPAGREAIAAALAAQGPAAVRWRLVAFGDADAWWVNGARAHALPDGNLRVAAGLPTERALSLDLDQVDRPVAFALPLADHGFEPRCVVRLEDAASVREALQRFEDWLAPVRALFAVGAMVIRRAADLRHSVHHLEADGTLLAVLDYRQGRIALHPAADPRQLWAAQWRRRPPTAAGEVPPGFATYTPAQVLWAYLRRTERDLLPSRYRTAAIYPRQVPRVPLKWLRDSQLLLLRELNGAPGTFDELRQRTGLAARVLAQDLSCFYYAGAVTTTPGKAAPSLPSGPQPLADYAHSGPGDAVRDLTVPAAREALPGRA